ncbi:LacI family DNA-binding transcriptional regulator [Spongisporangium articulatum]|uniref:LacI family DNA-binding transcriptional regulator n=1 Tax=Spongisporangium articulatum TaxID=3362603 RepID=A0ABW8AM57_9ACTN
MTEPRAPRATLSTIAEAAGVSIATVSKVLNGRSDVAPSTRALVQELLRQHDYVGRQRTEPDGQRSARAFQVSGPSVELLFHNDLNAYGVEVVQGVLDAGAAAQVAVIVSRREDQPAGGTGADWVADLVRAGRRAVISVVDELSADDIAALDKVRLPLVVVDPLNLPDAQITSIGSTNFAGGLSATQHLLELGHRRIAYIGGPVTAACNQARAAGFRAAVEAAGEEVPDAYVRTGDFMFDSALKQAMVLLDLPEPPTAVFAGSDETALAVIEAARSRGLRVPEDLSVVGFDDTLMAKMSSPALTTVRQPLREMGAVALRTALRLVAGEELDSHHVELATRLIVRDSTEALREEA